MENQNLLNFKTNGKAYWFTNPNDIFYFINFNSTNMDLIFIKEKRFILTDKRYLEQAKNEIKDVIVLEKTIENLNKIFKEISNKEIYIDGDYVTINQFNNLSKIFNDIKLIPFDFSKVRIIKNSNEVDLTLKAISYTEDILEKVTEIIKLNITEKEIADFIKTEALKINGVDKLAFETIVAFKESGANPHWSSSNRKIDSSGLLTIDLGLNYLGYNSDITRTFIIKKDNEDISEEEKLLFKYCDLALSESIKLISDGVPIKELDIKAREILSKGNYEEYFVHGLGHGLGIEVHEYPSISKYSDDTLKKGMIITIEPGIYIPNKYGIRIEEDVLVEENGYKILTNFKRKNIISI